jgi:hypothetical protein
MNRKVKVGRNQRLLTSILELMQAPDIKLPRFWQGAIKYSPAKQRFDLQHFSHRLWQA